GVIDHHLEPVEIPARLVRLRYGDVFDIDDDAVDPPLVAVTGNQREQEIAVPRIVDDVHAGAGPGPVLVEHAARILTNGFESLTREHFFERKSVRVTASE